MTSPADSQADPSPASIEAPGRRRLDKRRGHELVTFRHGSRVYTAGLGRFVGSDLAEVFLNNAKTGTDVETGDRDAAILASLALQHGCPVETLRGALTRNGDGSASGPIGALLDLLAREGEQ